MFEDKDTCLHLNLAVLYSNWFVISEGVLIDYVTVQLEKMHQPLASMDKAGNLRK